MFFISVAHTTPATTLNTDQLHETVEKLTLPSALEGKLSGVFADSGALGQASVFSGVACLLVLPLPLVLVVFDTPRVK